jgi:hypothetical protein
MCSYFSGNHSIWFCVLQENVTTHAHLLLGHIIQVKPECFGAETPREGKIAFALAVVYTSSFELCSSLHCF